VPVTLDQSESVCLVRLEGEINIALAVELKKLLLRTLASGKDLHLDMERATELDVTALQLVWAARRDARGAGLKFTLVGQVPAVIASSWKEAGFEKFPLGSDLD
jgi:anti-anti-sigma factor